MDTNQTSKPEIVAYNSAVTTAYFDVLKFAKSLIATIPSYDARCALELNRKHVLTQSKLHQFVSPMFYLSLECGVRDKLYIHFGYEQFDEENELAMLTAKFVRQLYKLTSIEYTKVSIEDCIHVNGIITTCSALYETIESSNYKRHTFKAIPFKGTKRERKVLQAVA